MEPIETIAIVVLGMSVLFFIYKMAKLESKSQFTLSEGTTKSNVKKNVSGKKAPPRPPARKITDYKMEWISVKERLPEPVTRCLVFKLDVALLVYEVAIFTDQFYRETGELDDVTELNPSHWMPLPEPPKHQL